ncbi:hypothetical protein AB1207_17560 [Kineococcus endophyticus]|uniref:Secreted protein n=1 Tax=Kineococcus endophyticus TaxID=1181883 RepID=A0ABV3PA87_9ACTN
MRSTRSRVRVTLGAVATAVATSALVLSSAGSAQASYWQHTPDKFVRKADCVERRDAVKAYHARYHPENYVAMCYQTRTTTWDGRSGLFYTYDIWHP